MSEFHAHLGNEDDLYQQPQRTSGMAIASLVCSLIICCPLITVLGPIFGAIALATIGSPPQRRGKGLAIAGIVIGLITTVLGIVAGMQIVRVVSEYIEFVEAGPAPALQAAAASDVNGFRSYFVTPAANASDEQVQAFFAEVQSRYGTFISATMDQQTAPPQFGSPVIVMPYILQFSDANNVSADVEIHFVDPQTQRGTKKLGYILIRDPDQGDLRFPPQP